VYTTQVRCVREWASQQACTEHSAIFELLLVLPRHFKETVLVRHMIVNVECP
jgi:hypothetical protein